MWGLPDRLETNAMFLLSGDQEGDTSVAQLRVNLSSSLFFTVNI